MSHGSRLDPRTNCQRSRRGTECVRPRGWVAAITALSVAAALLVVSAPGGAALNSVGSAQVAAASPTPGPAASGSYRPALAFANTEYSVLPMSRIFGSAQTAGFGAYAVPANQFEFLGELEMEQRSGNDLDLAYKVEDQGDSQHRYCRREWSQCRDVEVRVVTGRPLMFAGKALLYFWHSGSAGGIHWPAAYGQQRLEVSAWDSDSELKVYRELLVNPPPEASSCGEDYGENNPDAFTCLFLREMIPEGAGGSNEATLRDGLPDLVQPAANYRLTFAEEFDGTPPAANAAGCRDGLSTLDNDVWNYGDPCRNVDSRGESCGNVADGILTVAVAYNCGMSMNTFGKLQFKYGYLEFKYTINVNSWPGDHNMNVVAWYPNSPRQHLWKQYGVLVDHWEDFLTYGDIELDYLEYVPNSRHQSWNMHANWGRYVSTQLPQFRSNRQFHYCGGTSEPFFLFVQNPDGCKPTDTFTVTMGVEWTPRGYRSFTKVEPWQSDLTLWPEENLQIWGTVSGRQAVLRGDRSRFFEYLDPGDTSTLLEQVGIAHTPNPLSIGAFGISNSQWDHIRTRMKIDYIRLWQPDNHYSDMEPVYQ